MKSKFYKEHSTDKVWWKENRDKKGVIEFTFDRKTVFNLFADYPDKLTAEQKRIFDQENPYWANFFSGKDVAIRRKQDNGKENGNNAD